eukprot:2834085-Pleurochrysis_carterae.AAC.1
MDASSSSFFLSTQFSQDPLWMSNAYPFAAYSSPFIHAFHSFPFIHVSREHQHCLKAYLTPLAYQ